MAKEKFIGTFIASNSSTPKLQTALRYAKFVEDIKVMYFRFKGSDTLYTITFSVDAADLNACYSLHIGSDYIGSYHSLSYTADMALFHATMSNL